MFFYINDRPNEINIVYSLTGGRRAAVAFSKILGNLKTKKKYVTFYTYVTF